MPLADVTKAFSLHINIITTIMRTTDKNNTNRRQENRRFYCNIYRKDKLDSNIQ